jgi:hypothetical protein
MTLTEEGSKALAGDGTSSQGSTHEGVNAYHYQRRLFMNRTSKRSTSSLVLRIAPSLLLVLGAVSVSAGPARKATPDISGQWQWDEQVVVVGPGEFLMGAFQIPESEGPVMQLNCETSGTLDVIQNGASFSGSTDQDVLCTTKGGQASTNTPFPPFFTVEGSITGRSIHFEGPTGCTYHGSLVVENGVVKEINATGKCDVPIDVQPLVVENTYHATRL